MSYLSGEYQIQEGIANAIRNPTINVQEDVPVKVKRVRVNAVMPEYKTSGAAGFDLSAADEAYISSGFQRLVNTGLAFQLPAGFELQLRPRSGLALKHGITLTNAPATIDCDFNGEVGVIIRNTSKYPFKVEPGDRICQAVLKRVPKAEFIEVDELDETSRGEGGYGSTGYAQQCIQEAYE